MSSKAHSYHPTDDSLNAKVAALRSALKDQRNADQSLTAKAADRLGTNEEIEYGQNVSKETVERAFSALSAEDIAEVQARGLLSKKELIEIQAQLRTAQIKAKRSQSQDDESDHSLKG